ncbi:WS/DGAT domain-containing protein [Streptomyces sp. NPDC005900]|uniref:WS/DGAT domain-containing protein n=1 Tax=unclassified Streptomyces TaxID=2593676 RepID=UPI0033E9ECFB
MRSVKCPGPVGGTVLTPVEELLCGNGALPEPPIGMALLFEGRPPRLDELRDRVADRWGGTPLLSRTLLRPPPPTWTRRHRWSPAAAFDVRAQVVETRVEVPHADADGTAFTDLLGRLVAEPVPHGLPPWRLHLVHAGREHAPREAFALVLTTHHSLMDGRSLERLLSGLLDGATGRDGAYAGARSVRTPQAAGPVREAPARWAKRTGRVLDSVRPGRALPLDAGPPRAQRDLAWVDLDADAVRAARRALPGLGATLNEVLLACSAGALRAVHGAPDTWPGPSRPLFGIFSVDLRTPERSEELGNIVSVVRLPLPVAADGPRERLRACRATLSGSGPVYGASTATRLIGAASALGPWALRLLVMESRRPRYAPVTCIAIKWPRGARSLDGAPLTRVIPLPQVPIPGTVTLALVDLARTFTLCVVGHTPAGHAQNLADAFGRELTALGNHDPQLTLAAR